MNSIQRLTLFGLTGTVGRAWAQAPSNPAPLVGLPGGAGLPQDARPEVIDASTGFVLVSAAILLAGKSCGLEEWISVDPGMLRHAA